MSGTGTEAEAQVVSGGEGARRVAILGYHKIGPPAPGGWESWFYIPEAIFAAQLGYLRDHGWTVLDLATFLRGLEDPEILPRKAALLTFDDGYRSNMQVALPWLRRFGYPAVLFVPTDYIGRYNTFEDGAEPEEPICSWEELRELEAGGVAVQSHGISHRAFSALDRAEKEVEAGRSKRLLEEQLGRPVTLFSFPYGDEGEDPSATAELLCQTGYRAACLYGGGANLWPPANAFRLTRLAMGPDTDLHTVLANGTGR